MKKVEHLSSRWKNEEKETIVNQADKLSRGDISGWAKAVSKPFGSPSRPKRPEVGEVKREFHPVHNLNSLHALDMRPKLHDPSIVCMPADPKSDPRADMGRASTYVEVREKLHNFCITKIKRKSKKQLPEPPKPVDLLADCPAADISTIKPREIEREPEAYRYEDPFALKYSKRS